MARRRRSRSKKPKRKIGRDSESGQFIPVRVARRRKKTATVETI